MQLINVTGFQAMDMSVNCFIHAPSFLKKRILLSLEKKNAIMTNSKRYYCNGFITPFEKLLGPTQVKCRLLISSIFDAMNFQHFMKMLEIML